MNNHTNICQNINMIIFLIFLISFILILINKKVKFNIDFSIIGFEYNFCVNVNYFFDVITLYKEDLLKYKKDLSQQDKFSVNINNYKWIIDYLDIDRINLDLKIGLADVFFTSMTIPVISSIVAILLQKYCETSTKTFSVKPVYNKLFFSLKGATYITVKMKDMIYIVFKILKNNRKKVKNGKTEEMFELLQTRKERV